MRKMIMTVVGLMIAVMLVVVMIPLPMEVEAGAAHNLDSYLFNEGDDWLGFTANGPEDLAAATIFNLDDPASSSANISIPTLVPGIPATIPASFDQSMGTPWNWGVGDDAGIVFELIDGVNTYSGINKTGGGWYTLTGTTPDWHGGSVLTTIPTPIEDTNTLTDLVLDWNGMSTLHNYDGTPGNMVETNMLVDFMVYSDVSGSMQPIGASNANNPAGGTVTFTFNNYQPWAGVGGGDYMFKIVPRYEGPNYDNNANSLFECTASSQVLWVTKMIPGKDLDIKLFEGWNLVNLGGDDVAELFATASALAASIESRTDYNVLSVEDWEGGWMDYVRRDGTTETLISWHMATDFALDTAEESYMVYCAGTASDDIWEGLSQDGLSTVYSAIVTGVPYQQGWNNLLYPYGSYTTTSEIVASAGAFTYAAVWDYSAEGWKVNPGDGNFNILTHLNGGWSYSGTNNSAGFFVYATTSGTWNPSS